jgi:phosphoribosylamine--glycine ligase
MDRHNIPAPRFAVCSTIAEANAFITAAPLGYPFVIKADGLAAGKGTVIVANDEEARMVAMQIMVDKCFGNAGGKLVMEECLTGEEVSFLVFADGARAVPMVSVQDHKRALDGDDGPNTGGMGTVSPSTSLSLDQHRQIMQEVILPTIKGMADEGRRFQGVLYAGLMITQNGPKVLEFNARFGDPETQVIMARMKSDIVPLLQGVAEGNLKEAKIDWTKDAAVCVVLASKGYPERVETGKAIAGLAALKGQADIMVFHAATAAKDGQIVTVGGRVLGVTALGQNLDVAIQKAYGAVDKVSFEGMQYRKDIGRRALAHLHAHK